MFNAFRHHTNTRSCRPPRLNRDKAWLVVTEWHIRSHGQLQSTTSSVYQPSYQQDSTVHKLIVVWQFVAEVTNLLVRFVQIVHDGVWKRYAVKKYAFPISCCGNAEKHCLCMYLLPASYWFSIILGQSFHFRCECGQSADKSVTRLTANYKYVA